MSPEKPTPAPTGQSGAHLLVKHLEAQGVAYVFGIPGAKGFRIDTPDQIMPVLRKAMDLPGPVLIGVPVDYRDNPGLMAGLHQDVIH